MEAYKFRHLIWQFNMLLDTGLYDDLSLEDVGRHIDGGSIESFLTGHFVEGKIDLSPIGPNDWAEITEVWRGIYETTDLDRKMGVRNKGLCLLLALALECYQQKTR